MRRSPGSPLSLRIALVLACATLLGAVGCEGPVGSPRPSPSLVELDFTPQPTTTASAPPAASASSQPASWPIGWDVDFCQMFSEVVIAQQLIVDVERAIDDDATRDARLLAGELTLTATNATQLLTALPDWAEAQSASVEIAALMDVGGRAGTEYSAFFTEGKRAALRRARDLRRENAAQVPATNEKLAELTDTGLACPGTPLVLESP